MSLAPEVAVLLDRLRAHSMTTYRHCRNVGNICYTMAEGLGLQKEEVSIITAGGLLHDIGKARIRTTILHKAAQLSEYEWDIMKKHTDYGVQVLESNASFEVLIPLIAYHHERWDGTGYNGLAGEEIPLGARVISLADAFDAMTSSRCYKYSKNMHDGVNELAKEVGKQFDPRLVELFFDILPDIVKRNCYAC